MHKIIATAATLLLLATPTAVFAQAAASTPVDFGALDDNSSGGLDMAEAQTAWPALTQDQFIAADNDKSGSLSEDEVAVLPPPSPASQATPVPAAPKM
ncbi:MAG TPA: hypothetical protein VGM83_04025 [Devosiaceae bacterium]|jgi:hypothetical protein